MATVISQTMELRNAMFAWVQNFCDFPLNLGHCAGVGMGAGGDIDKW